MTLATANRPPRRAAEYAILSGQPACQDIALAEDIRSDKNAAGARGGGVLPFRGRRPAVLQAALVLFLANRMPARRPVTDARTPAGNGASCTPAR